jgi:hypothetical protein
MTTSYTTSYKEIAHFIIKELAGPTGTTGTGDKQQQPMQNSASAQQDQEKENTQTQAMSPTTNQKKQPSVDKQQPEEEQAVSADQEALDTATEMLKTTRNPVEILSAMKGIVQTRFPNVKQGTVVASKLLQSQDPTLKAVGTQLNRYLQS